MADSTENRWWRAWQTLWQGWRSPAKLPSPPVAQQQPEEGIDFWALEARLMFDGAALVEHHPLLESPAEVERELPAQPQAVGEVNRERHEVVFIDSRVGALPTLLQHVKPGETVVVLDGQRDGVEQISQFLAQAARDGLSYDAIHIVSHGMSGGLLLGGAVLSDATLPRYAEALQQWGEALQQEGDLILYGCQVGAGAEGALFLQKVSQLTGADVAASNDLTGSAMLGGNWNLEVTTGSIESSIAFTPEVGQAYDHVLATLTVTTTDDEAYGSGTLAAETADGAGLSLREAMGLATSSDTVTFASALSGSTIMLTSSLSTTTTITITDSLTISGDTNGDHVADVTIQGNGTFQIFRTSIASGKTVTLDGLIISNGYNSSTGGGVRAQGAGTTTISYSTITDNDAGTGMGGGIYNQGTMIITHSSITGNTALGSGGDAGGIYNASGANLTISDSSITGNEVGDGMGGGIYNQGTMIITQSSITGNTASGSSGDAGGIYNSASANLTISDSSITGNTANNNAGGIRSVGTLTITDSDISNNQAGTGSSNSSGGGIYIQSGTVTISNSTILNNEVVNASSASGAGVHNGGTLTLTATIIAGNTIGASTANDLSGTGSGITSSGTNNYVGASNYTGSLATGSSSLNSVTVTAGNDAPVLSASASSATLVEAGGTANATAGTSSSTVTLVKADMDSTVTYDTSWLTSDGWSTADAGVTYSKSGTYGTATLTIASDTVTYALNNSSAATEALYSGQSVSETFTVRVTDGALTASKSMTFTITGSNDGPLITSNGGGSTASISVAQNTTAVTTAIGSDVDSGTTLTYSISGGADAGKFTVNASTGVLTFITAPVYAAPTDSNADNVYLVTVQVSDGTLSTTQALSVTVYNANVAPTGSVTISGTVARNQTLTAANKLADTTGLGEISYQ
ncbi:MAG: DUF4347 domain-containing protein, partial [Magnetococcales bacterium]|nr:DUF4347 domain-containing protein [Magnetococcales bacterium]